MKKILFVMVLLPFVSFAQPGDTSKLHLNLLSWGNNRAALDSTVKFVSLPPLWRSDLSKVYEIGRFGSYGYIVAHDSTYYKIFSRYSKDSLPKFDFSKQELVVRISCRYCSTLGVMDDGEPKHRNSCAYKDFWFVRDKSGSRGVRKTEREE